MASTSAFSMAMPLTCARHNTLHTSDSLLFRPLPVKPPSKAMAASRSSSSRLTVKASLKDKAITGLAAAALTATMVIPEAAEAASGVSPSLKNFLLSIAAGGVVVTAIIGAVVGVSNFDPVKRG